MGKKPIQIDPPGLRTHQQSCTRYVMLLVLIATVVTFVLASAMKGF